MAFYADETITVAAGEIKSLTSTLYKQTGVANASRALVTNIGGGGTDILHRYITDPDTSVSPKVGVPLPPGGQIEIQGYDNIKNIKFALDGASTATLFVQYSS